METEDIIGLIQGLGTLIISIIALCFSIYAFKKVSLKSDFKKKQLNVLFELIEILQDTIFIINKKDIKSPNTTSGTMFRFFRINYEYDRYKELVDSDYLVMSEDPDKKYDFIKYSEHPFIPPEIASIIREFVAYINFDLPISEKNIDTYIILGGLDLFEDDQKLYQITDNPVYSSFDSFCRQCLKLDKAIHVWLKKIGIKEFNKKKIIE